jgi:ornithine carbamoyltransferase
MGQESEREERIAVFKNYQVNDELISRAKNDVMVMHCLPAHRGESITNDAIDGPHSVVFDQAENRLHVQKAILDILMGGEKYEE